MSFPLLTYRVKGKKHPPAETARRCERGLHMKGKTAALALACALALLGTACGSVQTTEETAAAHGSTAAHAQENGAGWSAAGDTEAEAAGEALSDGDAGAPAADRQVIRTANLSLETKQYDEALALVRGAAAESGGYIGHTASYADSGARSTSFTCRIPAAAYAEFLEAVRAAGSVQYAEEGTKDATNEYVDLEARLKSLRTQETRLLALLEESGSLEELLAVQEKLTAVQYEIERYTGEMKALENSIEYAAVSVYVEEVEAYTPVEPDFGARIAAAFSDMLRGVASGAQGVIIALVYALPLFAAGGAVTVVVLLCVRRKRRRRRPPVTPQENMK